MKIKSLFFLIMISVLIFFIYVLNQDKKIYYVDIQDKTVKLDDYNKNIVKELKKNNKLEKYIYQFSDNDYRITDLINDINDNKTIKINNKIQTIQNALIKSDILTIRMGESELEYKINNYEVNELFNYCDTLVNDIEELFILLRKYSKEDIYFIGLYNNHSEFYNEIYNYLNLKIEDVAKEYNIIFISQTDNNSKISKKIVNLSL